MNNYELPIPILDTSCETINIETKYRFDNYFTIKNTGGGILKGHVLSRCPGLTFYPDTWSGNNQKIKYTFLPQETGLKSGESAEFSCFITSNGGEIKLPVTVKLVEMSITTDEKIAISSVQDLFEYSQTHPTQAQQIFKSMDFYELLHSVNYEYMELYDTLHKDSNHKRAMDNFFILSGLKGKTALSFKENVIEFVQKPDDKITIEGNITIYKSDNGYVETTILEDSDWLTLTSNKLTAYDFDSNNTAIVNFKIDPLKINTSYARGKILFAQEAFIGNNNFVEVVHRRTAPLIISMEREAFQREDKGIIKVVNNTGGMLQIRPRCDEKYIQFAANIFPVGAVGEIPFDVKLSGFMTAQLKFRKIPYLQTEIIVEGRSDGRKYIKILPIVVGEW